MIISEHSSTTSAKSMLVLAATCLFILSCHSSDNSSTSGDSLAVLMDSIKQIYVPGRRVEIFDFEIQSNRITGRTSLSEAYESVKMLQNRFKDLNLDSF